ncbi:general L-amino acid transport system permease protein [Rhodobium orientis]|nr:ABC transporter permease subunit [Rhodobium orientis]MBB4301059.1 general L-amino acid transport system permease protein [Rhodobium orientis]
MLDVSWRKGDLDEAPSTPPATTAAGLLPPPPPSLLGPALWRTRRGRAVLWQVFGAVVLFVVLLVFTRIMYGNLVRQNLNLGLDFLNREAGIDIAESIIPYAPEDSLGWMILVGAANTLRVAIIACILSTVIGVVVGVMRVSENPLLKLVTGAYVNLARNTPQLLQILFWYTLLLQLPVVRNALSLGDTIFLSQRGLQVPALEFSGDGTGLAAAGAAATALFLILAPLWRTVFGRSPHLVTRLVLALIAFIAVAIAAGAFSLSPPVRGTFNFTGGMTLTPEFVALTVAQSLYAGAFIAELVRGGIEGVHQGQREAAGSLGLSNLQMLRLVVVPQALLAIVPSVTTQYISVIKNSSLAIAIGFPDFFWALSTTINFSGHSIEGVAIMVGGYLLPTLLAATLMNRFNKKLVERGQR